MAQISTSTWANELQRIYNRESLFEPMERHSTPCYDMFKEADDVEPLGAGLYFRLILNSANRVGTPSEGGDYPSGNTRTTLQGVVNGVQIASAFEISEMALSRTKGDGSFSGDGLHDAVVEAAQNLYSHIERLLVVSHGTGKLGEVQSAVSTSTQVVCALPQGVQNLKAGMLVDFYDLDSGGSAVATNCTISSINRSTRTLTLSATTNLNGGESIYIAGYYGVAPFGLRGIVDDGDLMASFYGNTRSNYPRLNAVMDETGSASSPQTYSEKIVRKLIHEIMQEVDMPPTDIVCNSGVIGAHLDSTIPDRQYTVAGKNVPSYGVGYDEGQLFFQYQNNKLPFRIFRDMPARELFVINRKTFRKHTLRKPDWLGTGSDMLKPVPGTNTYKLAYQACMLANMNISCRIPKANGGIRYLKDEEIAGDS